MLDALGVPLSAFVQTSVLADHPKALEVLSFLSDEVHSHSHTHASQNFDSKMELSKSLDVLDSSFNQSAYGYRAPYGKLYPGDEEIIQSLGYAFDSSVFPSFRPGKFNHLSAPLEPWRWPNGLLELPFAALPKVRLILGISYMKLFGPALYNALIPVTGLPKVLMFYGHMHDFFPTDAVRSFSPLLRTAFSRNGHRPIEIAEAFFKKLQGLGYEFLTLNELAQKVGPSVV